MVGLRVFKGDTSRASEDILRQSPEALHGGNERALFHGDVCKT